MPFASEVSELVLASGQVATTISNLHSRYSYEKLDVIFKWLKENNFNYQCYGDDLFLYNSNEATLFLMRW